MRFHQKIIAAAIMLACTAPAQAQIFKVRLSGAAENPPVTTNGTGSAVVTFNSNAHQMRVKTSFAGLNGTTTAAHIHCCAAPTANAGVATMTPTFLNFPAGVTQGSYDQTFDLTQAGNLNAAFITANGGTPASAEAALIANARNGLTYLNIHSSAAPGGEIRGTLVPFTFATYAASNPAVAAALDSLGAGTGATNTALVTLAGLDSVPLYHALVQLTPLSLSAAGVLASDSLFSNYDQISNRLGGLRAEGASGTGNLWMRYANGEAEHDLDARGVGIETDREDVFMGIDYHVTDALLLGLSLGIQHDDLNFDGALAGSTGELESARATLYSELALGNAFVEGMISFGSGQQEGRRNAGTFGIAESESDHEQWGGRLAAGTVLGMGAELSLTPQVRFDWSYIDLEGYTETGAGPLGLVVDTGDLERERVSLGAQLDWNLNATTTPFLRGFWGHEFGDDNYVTGASFIGGGTAFQTSEDGLDSNGYTAGFGVNIRNDDGLEGSISYDYSDNDVYESGMMNLRLLLRI